MFHLRYNEDGTCFGFGSDEGFRVYNTEPLKERFHRVLEGGISIVEVLQKTNICFLVGGGLSPAFPPSKVIVWDDRQNKSLAELEFPSKVMDIICRQPYVMIRTENKLHVYETSTLQEVTSFISNYPLADFSSYLDRTVLAFPDKIPGRLRIEILNKNTNNTKTIKTHDNKLTQIALSRDGNLIATCSSRGTLIRIWNTETGKLEKELRRGVDATNITNLVFHPDKNALLASSVKGTVHIFTLDYPINNKSNKTSTFSFMKGVLPSYFNSEWSMVSFHHPNQRRCYMTFGQTPNTVIIIDNKYRYVSYNYLEGKAIQSISL